MAPVTGFPSGSDQSPERGAESELGSGQEGQCSAQELGLGVDLVEWSGRKKPQKRWWGEGGEG